MNVLVLEKPEIRRSLGLFRSLFGWGIRCCLPLCRSCMDSYEIGWYQSQLFVPYWYEMSYHQAGVTPETLPMLVLFRQVRFRFVTLLSCAIEGQHRTRDKWKTSFQVPSKRSNLCLNYTSRRSLLSWLFSSHVKGVITKLDLFNDIIILTYFWWSRSHGQSFLWKFNLSAKKVAIWKFEKQNKFLFW